MLLPPHLHMLDRYAASHVGKEASPLSGYFTGAHEQGESPFVSVWTRICLHYSILCTMTGGVEIDAVVESRTDLGESPVWDERTQRLYFIDINEQTIHMWDNKSKSHDHITMPEMVGTIILAPNEEQLVVALTRYGTFNFDKLAGERIIRCP